jgi:hypothetical protein
MNQEMWEDNAIAKQHAIDEIIAKINIGGILTQEDDIDSVSFKTRFLFIPRKMHIHKIILRTAINQDSVRIKGFDL